MDKKKRNVVLLTVAYVIVLLIGFRSGEIYNRMQKGYKAEGIIVPAQGSYIVIEERDYGTYRYADISECSTDNVLIRCFLNEKLKPILKLKKIQIYNMAGDRVY